MDLCQSAVAHTPVRRDHPDVGTGRTPVTASDLVLDPQQLDGDLYFGSVELGRDAAMLNAAPGVTGTHGGYGQRAQTLNVDGMRLASWSVTAGLFNPKGAASVILAVLLGACAVHMWSRPGRAAYSGWLVIALGVVSYPLADLGGFLLGMLLAFVGGSLAVARRPVGGWRGDGG
ncbi:DUF6230 family protein [Streptomyces sp. RPT161]|uniref:DUF6230 family protein n=1 Tax=Streptomyces sp. RPT161 TaxID=3015993 RepID=UPI0022B8D91F|nr:DUF6230 family protein [Streptomyces sp. RPT161]